MAALDPVTPVAPQAPPVTFRKFDDIEGQRADIYGGAVQALKGFKPAQNATHKVEIVDPEYDSEDFAPGLADEKEAILKQRSLHRALKGTVRLSDAQGNVLDEQRMTIAHIPHLNSRGLFIRNGSPYILRNQLRLRPGAYTREKKNGGLETHFNVKPGTGRGFRVEMEPEDGVFKMKIGQSGTRLYPLLRELGIPDEDMEKAWGKELFEKNHRAKSGKDDIDLVKVAQKFSKDGLAIKPEEAKGIISDALGRAELDEDTTHLTLGERIKNLRPDVLLKATKKQLDVAQGKVEADNRDSQAFQSIHGADDLMKERLGRDITGGLRQILWRASREGNLKSAKPGFLNKNVSSLFEGSGLSQQVEDVSPIETMDLRQAITRMGDGGISDESSVSREARNVQGSYLGVIDSGRAPESSRMGLDLRVTDAALKGSDNQLYTTVRNVRTGEMETKSARDLSTKVVTFPGEWSSPDKRIPVVKGGSVTHALKDEVDYEVVHPHDLMSRATQLVPFSESVKGARALMGARMSSQALPLDEGEAPFVQTAMADGSSLHKAVGLQSGARTSPTDGVVTKVGHDFIEVADSEGKRHKVDLYHNYPMSRKTVLHNDPVVSVGTPVTKGQVVAKSNYTDKDGNIAVGRNLKIAFMASKGNTIEDAFELSESAARKLATQNMYKSELSTKDMVSTKKDDYTAIYGDKFKPHQLDKLDDNGVIRVGMQVNPGDPLILGVGKREPGPIGALMDTPKSTTSDKAEIWDHHNPGVVTDVAHTRDGIRVFVKSKTALTPGSKLSGLHGNKGVVSVIRPDNQMPVSEDGKPIDVIFNTFGIISRCYDASTEVLTRSGWKLLADVVQEDLLLAYDTSSDQCYFSEQIAAMHVSDYSGTMFGYRSDNLDFLVTPGHKFWASPEHRMSWDETNVDKLFGKRAFIPYLGNYKEEASRNLRTVELPEFWATGRMVKPARSFDIHDFCELLGWFLAEGHLAKKEGKTFISQSDTANPKKVTYIGVLLARLGLSFHYKHSVKGWVIYDKQLTDWIASNCGERKQKRIPRFILNTASFAALTRMFTGLWMGDGHVGEVGTRVSPRIKLTALGLVDDIQEMLVYMGLVSRKTDVTAGERRGNPRCAPAHMLGVHLQRTPRLLRHGWYKQEYCGKVYCPSVTTGYVVTRRNGTIVVAGNTNPGVLSAALLGKVVEKTGKPYLVKPFGAAENVADFALNELEKHGLKELETVTDPADNRKIPNIFVGNGFVMALQHQAEGKLSARGQGSYTTEGYPARGGSEGSKRVSLSDVGVLVSAGATNFLKDTKLIRGQRNDDYWRQLKMGETPMAPEGSIADEQFKTQLAGAGVLIKEHGSKQQLRPMLDKDVDAMAQHEIQNSKTFDFNSLEPIKGGLFDIGMTGGAGGNRFSKISLGVKVPHPLFVDPIIRILGITNNKLEGVMKGTEELNGKTGQEALESALKGVDVDREMELAKNEIKSGKTSRRDAAVKRLQYLSGLKTLGVSPEDLMVSKVAVVPPKYRPVVSGENVDMIHDLNYLYHDLMEAKHNHQEAKKEFGKAGDEYWTVFKAVQAVSGMDDPVTPKSVESGVKGILKTAIGVGSSPKNSTFQRRVVGNSVDMVGRGVITADANLDMDSVGIPINMAWNIFKPFVIRRLVQNGMPSSEAVQAVTDQSFAAKKALEAEMKERPLVYNRAPALHRYAYTGGWGKLVNDDAIHMPYSSLKSMTGDFDGDAEGVHVPVTAEAVEDVKNKMMPSKNLFFTGDFETHYEPQQDYVAGLHLAGKMDPSKPVKTFATAEDAKLAYLKGEISARTPVRILKK